MAFLILDSRSHSCKVTAFIGIFRFEEASASAGAVHCWIRRLPEFSPVADHFL